MPIYKNEKNNSWYIKTYVKDKNGKPKQITKRNKEWIGRKGKELAQQEEIRLKNNYTKNNNNTNHNKVITFQELSEKYLIEYKKNHKDNSYTKVLNRYNLYVKNDYPNKLINEISKYDHREFKEKLNNKRKRNGSLLSTTYKNIIHGLVVSIFNYGIEEYDLEINPAMIAKGFKKREDEIKKQIDYWSLDDFLKLESVVDNQIYKTLFSFLYLLGTRRGESLALTWEDGLKILKTKELYIYKTCSQNVGKNIYEITTPKTESSIRYLSVPEMAYNELKKLYEQESKKDGFNENWFIFGGIKPIPKTTLDNNLHKYVKIANLNYISPHKLRHSFGTYLLQSSNGKITISDISKFLGHADINTTMKTYLHVYRKEQNKISNYWDTKIKNF